MTKSRDGYWNCGVLGTIPNQSFAVQVLSGASIMVGMAFTSNFQPDGTNYNRCGYYIYLSTGTLYSQEGHNGTPYFNRRVENGSVIRVEWDSEERTISYRIDNQSYGVAYRVTVPGDLFPAVEMYYAVDSVTFVD